MVTLVHWICNAASQLVDPRTKTSYDCLAFQGCIPYCRLGQHSRLADLLIMRE